MAVKAGCDGNFADGLCCRMVIETKRVFDGCKFTDENIALTLTTESAIPQGAEFESARLISSELVGYSVSPGAGGCCQVCGEIVSRFAVTYSYNGTFTTVQAVYRENRSVLLHLPSSNSLVPYTIEVSSVMSIASGAIIAPNAVTVRGCLLQIIKVTAPVDILIPTYGYCHYPPCTGSVCQGLNARTFPSFDNEQ